MLIEYFCAGFEKNQAELIVSALVTLATANVDVVYKDMVTKSHQVGTRDELHPRAVSTELQTFLSLGDRPAADHGSPGLRQEGHGDPGEERVR